MADPIIFDMLQSEGVVQLLTKSSELDDLLAFAGQDIVIYAYSSAFGDDSNLMTANVFADMAGEISKKSKKIKFVAYDFNMLGLNKVLGITHPTVWLSPGQQRHKKPRLFRGSFNMEMIAEWIVKHVDNKFKMNTKDLDQRVQMMKYAQEQGMA